jgi:hypothetical protein
MDTSYAFLNHDAIELKQESCEQVSGIPTHAENWDENVFLAAFRGCANQKPPRATSCQLLSAVSYRSNQFETVQFVSGAS